MKLPTKDWEAIETWAARNDWSAEQARDAAFNNNCIELANHLKVVRLVPDPPYKPKPVKISKSDQ